MGPVELLAILILAGAVIVLIYYYLMESGNGRGVRTQIYGIGERIGAEEGEGYMSGVGEKVSGMGDRIMGKVRDVPISTDVISNKIDAFLNEKSDELIEDWELATKNDINDLQKRLNLISRNIDELERRFNEYRGYTNKKLESLDERLKRLEEERE
ncbi:hypothetical protein U2150_00860 [Methanothermobacter wolfeii]|uniref:Uncharacterized protein n=1 Tax=Methanothermobacter wolfeii TaxID=145261 RepID=A0A9E7RUG3_METWO|nr:MULTISPECIES: hypothetical protein [Methanothermobacter]MDI6702571.1 hypothetical protein [Methanothermobacter wolfeii]MDI6841788.1 hypothetical protein [Methanothermobacter wolfeii]NLM02218.1 hypothetical protein [Methanothermobacter wolfeii]QHN07006.1 hypothetical protein FZP57_08240 [Methanothermobacter sp. THM-1]UXH31602.1 hypothetical protein N5910_08705 [Methanothermobacter wolfeii]